MCAIILLFEMHLAKGAIYFTHYFQPGSSRENAARCASADSLMDTGIKFFRFYILKSCIGLHISFFFILEKQRRTKYFKI